MNNKKSQVQMLQEMAVELGLVSAFDDAIMRKERRAIRNCRGLEMSDFSRGAIAYTVEMRPDKAIGTFWVLIIPTGGQLDAGRLAWGHAMSHLDQELDRDTVRKVLDTICQIAAGDTIYSYDHGRLLKVGGSYQKLGYVHMDLVKLLCGVSEAESESDSHKNVETLWKRLSSAWNT